MVRKEQLKTNERYWLLWYDTLLKINSVSESIYKIESFFL